METWLFLHWIEVPGTFFAIIYLYFSINEKIWLWPIGFIASLFYLIVFFKSRLYADMSLQVYYIGVSIYGWFHWIGKIKPTGSQISITTSSLSLLQWIPICGAIIALNFILYYLLISLPGILELPASDMPVLDAFTTASSIVATWMLARKILENWVLWIVIDVVSLGMYFYKGLYVTTFLFVIYTVMAFIGYLQWKKMMVISLNKK